MGAKFILNRLYIIMIGFSALVNIGYCDMENLGGDDVNLNEVKDEALFVSLGSYCAPASILRSCGLRKAAFPFDWMISLNGEKLIEMLDDKFSNFFNEDYFVPGSPGYCPALLHTHYLLEFVHDGTWGGSEHFQNFQLLKSKFTKRINRFLQLNEYPGKVFFIRSAYIFSDDNPQRYYLYKENLEITDEYALRLYQSLKNCFPDLDFSLIIVNNHKDEHVKLEKKIADDIYIVRAPAENEKVMIAAYEKFFNWLLHQE